MSSNIIDKIYIFFVDNILINLTFDELDVLKKNINISFIKKNKQNLKYFIKYNVIYDHYMIIFFKNSEFNYIKNNNNINIYLNYLKNEFI